MTEQVTESLVPHIREFIVQAVGADMGELMTKQASDLAKALEEPVRELLVKAWDEGASKASHIKGAYLRSILIENPYWEPIPRIPELPVTREEVPKGISVYPDGSSVEVHHGYTVLHAEDVVATPREAVRES